MKTTTASPLVRSIKPELLIAHLSRDLRQVRKPTKIVVHLTRENVLGMRPQDGEEAGRRFDAHARNGVLPWEVALGPEKT